MKTSLCRLCSYGILALVVLHVWSFIFVPAAHAQQDPRLTYPLPITLRYSPQYNNGPYSPCFTIEAHSSTTGHFPLTSLTVEAYSEAYSVTGKIASLNDVVDTTSYAMEADYRQSDHYIFAFPEFKERQSSFQQGIVKVRSCIQLPTQDGNYTLQATAYYGRYTAELLEQPQPVDPINVSVYSKPLSVTYANGQVTHSALQANNGAAQDAQVAVNPFGSSENESVAVNPLDMSDLGRDSGFVG